MKSSMLYDDNILHCRHKAHRDILFGGIKMTLEKILSAAGKVWDFAKESGMKVCAYLEKQQQEYDTAYENLARQGFEDWDNEKLVKELKKNRHKFYEHSIILGRLNSVKKTDTEN